MPVYHLTLTKGDRAKIPPCPFCGSADVEALNTHAACYWVECLNCSAEVSGEAFGSGRRSENQTRANHVKAKRSAIRAWSRRVAAADLVRGRGTR